MIVTALVPPTCEATGCDRPANLYFGVCAKHLEGTPDVARTIRYCAYHLRLAREAGSEVVAVGGAA